MMGFYSLLLFLANSGNASWVAQKSSFTAPSEDSSHFILFAYLIITNNICKNSVKEMKYHFRIGEK